MIYLLRAGRFAPAGTWGVGDVPHAFIYRNGEEKVVKGARRGRNRQAGIIPAKTDTYSREMGRSNRPPSIRGTPDFLERRVGRLFGILLSLTCVSVVTPPSRSSPDSSAYPRRNR